MGLSFSGGLTCLSKGFGHPFGSFAGFFNGDALAREIHNLYVGTGHFCSSGVNVKRLS